MAFPTIPFARFDSTEVYFIIVQKIIQVLLNRHFLFLLSFRNRHFFLLEAA